METTKIDHTPMAKILSTIITALVMKYHRDGTIDRITPPTEVVDQALLNVAQLPHDRIRALGVVAVLDDGTPEGVTVDITGIGDDDLLEAAVMMLGETVTAGRKAARRATRPRNPMPDLEEILRRGAGDPRGAPFGGFPRGAAPNGDVELLGLLMALSAMGR